MSTIQDADMAAEMTAYTKNNVLLQAAVDAGASEPKQQQRIESATVRKNSHEIPIK